MRNLRTSVGHTPQPSMRTSSSPGPGSGTGSDSTRRSRTPCRRATPMGAGLLLIGRSSVIMAAHRRGIQLEPQIQGPKRRVDGRPAPGAGSRAGRGDDVEHMEVVIEVGQRRALRPDGGDQLPQPVGPVPGRVERFVLLPYAGVCTPDLESGWIPVVAEQIGGAGRPVELEPGAPITPDGMAGNDRRERTRTVPHAHVDHVRVGLGDRLAGDVPWADADGFGRLYLVDGPEQRGQ